MGSQVPERIGRYVIESELGRGGMGAVYRARDPSMNRRVAIKTIASDWGLDEETCAQFLREGEMCGALRHPNVVNVFSADVDDGVPYLVMEYVEGETLEERLAREPIEREELLRLIRETALGLQHAHERGVVHRDVKPQNILVDRDGHARLTDFGLAFHLETKRFSESGEAQGSAYMAPEQARGDDETHGPATDVWGLGAVLYRGLVGRPPFEAADPLSLLQDIILKEPRRLRRLDRTIPRALQKIVLRCLKKDPAERWGSAAELAAELERAPLRAWPVGLLAVLALVVLIAVAVAVGPPI